MAAPPPPEPLVPRALFGGALAVALPARFVDVSAFRQVPDTQEVFSDAATDQSIIVELLELDASAASGCAAAFHFEQLARDNDATAAEMEMAAGAGPLPHGGECSHAWGHQRVAKFNEHVANGVRVHVTCLRYPHVATDVVLSYNAPDAIGAGSSSARQIDPGLAALAAPAAVRALHAAVASTLVVNDFGLFAVS
jgi:hypothetical protein